MTFSVPSRSPSFLARSEALAFVARAIGRWFNAGAPPRPEEDDPESRELMRRAAEAQRANRAAEAATLYRQVLQRQKSHLTALRALRDIAVESRQWREALDLQQRVIGLAGPTERARESEWLAAIHYEQGRAELGANRSDTAIGEFKLALRADRRFVPASLALGDAHEAAGDVREAVRVWERAVELDPSLPILARLEREYRREGRPSRMIALYRAAAERSPDDLGLAVALGRVYLELEMLDEAADQFEKVEVRAPDLPVVHAFLGAVFERRGEIPQALEEYRRALGLGHGFTWPHRCHACGTEAPSWREQCAQCQRWNTLRPSDGRG